MSDCTRLRCIMNCSILTMLLCVAAICVVTVKADEPIGSNVAESVEQISDQIQIVGVWKAVKHDSGGDVIKLGSPSHGFYIKDSHWYSLIIKGNGEVVERQRTPAASFVLHESADPKQVSMKYLLGENAGGVIETTEYYKLADEELVLVSPREGEQLRSIPDATRPGDGRKIVTFRRINDPVWPQD